MSPRSSTLVTIACLFASTAHAQPGKVVPFSLSTPPEPPRVFGKAHTWTVSGDTGLEWNTGSSVYLAWVDAPGGDVTVLKLQPSIDYFVLDHFSLGFTLGLTYVSVTQDKSVATGSTVHAGGRIGGSIPLYRDISSLWLRASVVTSRGTGNLTHHLFQIQAPLVAHAFSHFFVGFGPIYEHLIRYRNEERTFSHSFGLLMTLGGWFPRGS
jgi:hypothetical protein